MGNRGDAFWNVLLRGVRDKHSNDLSIKKVMILKIGRGGGERGKKKNIFFLEDIVDEPKNKIESLV